MTLEWWRCPDGVEVVEADSLDKRGIIRLSPYIRYRSEKRGRPLITGNLEGPVITTNLTDPLVVRFVNATTEDSLIQFFDRYGFTGLEDETDMGAAIEERDILTASLEEAASGKAGLGDFADLLDDIRLRPAFDRRSGRLALRAVTLLDFLTMEVVLVLLAKARLGRCQSCGVVFLTGPMTNRRVTAEFCGDVCRQQNHRKRLKEGGNVSPKAKMEARKRA